MAERQRTRSHESLPDELGADIEHDPTRGVRIAQFRGDSQFATWLHRLVVNTCRDVAERQRTRAHEPLPEEFGADLEHDPARGVRISELRRELCDSLAGISPEQAQVIVLKDALGYTFEEIAAAADMPVGTAKCHAHRGRNRLRERLEDRDVA